MRLKLALLNPKDSWQKFLLLSCLLAVVSIALIFMSWKLGSAHLKNDRARHAQDSLSVKYNDLVKSDQAVLLQAKALRVLYSLSDPEADMLAREFNLAAARDSVDWTNFAAVCRIESNFNPTAASPAGCKGLMQLKDSTAIPYAKRIGARWTKVSPWIDALNVRVGCLYLGELVRRFGDSTGIKMYIAGEPNIKKSPKMPAAEDYMAIVLAERLRLKYIYRGIQAEGGSSAP